MCEIELQSSSSVSSVHQASAEKVPGQVLEFLKTGLAVEAVPSHWRLT
jgi:hypothetical protein